MNKVDPKIRKTLMIEAGVFVYTASTLLSDLLSKNISLSEECVLFIF